MGDSTFFAGNDLNRIHLDIGMVLKHLWLVLS